MKTKQLPKLLGVVVIGIMFTAPLWSNNTTKTTLTKNSQGVLNNTEFVVTITDKQVSNSGLPYCKMYIKSIEKTLVGSCNPTNNNITFKVGWNYKIEKAQIKDENIIIYKATPINSTTQLTVVRLTHRAGTKLAELSNGTFVGGSNLNVGDLVNTQ
jgi:hypothetical protein